VKAFAVDARGATAIEYCLIAAFVSIVIVAAVTSIGTGVNTLLSRVLTGFH
jgi:pilus assembly protein Flp/PilA